MDFPKYLYHYTNLSSLCSILKSGMIRFNPLTKMDDMDEAEIRDFKNFAKYVFVSSWTSDSRESIPFGICIQEICRVFDCGLRHFHLKHMSGIIVRKVKLLAI